MLPTLNLNSNNTAPAIRYTTVVPSNTVELPEFCRSLYVGVGGDVALVAQTGSTPVIFVGVPTGSVLPVGASKVLSTGTTASNIVALY